MQDYLTLLLIPVIGYFGWTCGRSYGWAGYLVFLGALLGLAGFVFVIAAPDPDQIAPLSFVAVIGMAAGLAAITGAFGVAKRRAALQSAGTKTPKSG